MDDAGIVKPFLADLLRSARKAQHLRGVACDLTLEQLQGLWLAADGRCQLTGMLFDFEKAGRRRRPFAPSLDRIDSNGTYTLKNVRLVCVIANYVKLDFTDGDFHKMAMTYAERFGQQINPETDEEVLVGSLATHILNTVYGPKEWPRIWAAINAPFVVRRSTSGRPMEYRVPTAALIEVADRDGHGRAIRRIIAERRAVDSDLRRASRNYEHFGAAGDIQERRQRERHRQAIESQVEAEERQRHGVTFLSVASNMREVLDLIADATRKLATSCEAKAEPDAQPSLRLVADR